MTHKEDALELAVGGKFGECSLRIHTTGCPGHLGDIDFPQKLGHDSRRVTGTDHGTGEDEIRPQALLLHEATYLTRLLVPPLGQATGEIILAMRLCLGMSEKVEKHGNLG
jgi:hypothetical protein